MSSSVMCGILVCTCVMILVNCSMYNPSGKCVVFPWKILSVKATGCTMKQYFTETIGKELVGSADSLELVGVFLGRAKDQLDVVDFSVLLDMVVQSFGGVVFFRIKKVQ